VSVSHQDQTIEEIESGRTWLMDGADDGLSSFVRQFLQQLHNFHGPETVQS